jgi:dolichol-phosphate mannosyltransferase
MVSVLNEAKVVGQLFERCLWTLKNYETEAIVVDGYSSDGSAAIARRAGATVIYEKGRGYGSAYLTGFDYVQEEDSEAVVVMIDGDQTCLPEDIPTVIEPIIQGEADLVIGIVSNTRMKARLPG